MTRATTPLGPRHKSAVPMPSRRHFIGWFFRNDIWVVRSDDRWVVYAVWGEKPGTRSSMDMRTILDRKAVKPKFWKQLERWLRQRKPEWIMMWEMRQWPSD